MQYPAKFIEDDKGGFVVAFRDVPESLTQGDTFEEALDMASDALKCGLEFYVEAGKPLPEPSAARHGEVIIDLSN